MADSKIYVANTDFSTDLDGVPTNVQRGERVRAGHPLVMSNPQYFSDVETTVKYDVESASAAPGEQRGAPGPTVVVKEASKEELLERARALHVEGRASMDKDQLATAVAKAEKAKK
jgi:hypothetical protein